MAQAVDKWDHRHATLPSIGHQVPQKILLEDRRQIGLVAPLARLWGIPPEPLGALQLRMVGHPRHQELGGPSQSFRPDFVPAVSPASVQSHPHAVHAQGRQSVDGAVPVLPAHPVRPPLVLHEDPPVGQVGPVADDQRGNRLPQAGGPVQIRQPVCPPQGSVLTHRPDRRPLRTQFQFVVFVLNIPRNPFRRSPYHLYLDGETTSSIRLHPHATQNFHHDATPFFRESFSIQFHLLTQFDHPFCGTHLSGPGHQFGHFGFHDMSPPNPVYDQHSP